MRDYFVGKGSLFHFPHCRKLNDDLAEETGIEDQTPPGILVNSLDLAFETFGPDCPMIITMDERTVSSTLTRTPVLLKAHIFKDIIL